MEVEKKYVVLDSIKLSSNSISDSVVRYQSSHTEKSASWLDNLILDVVSCLKDPNGSTKSVIAMYIEETHTTPPNFRRLLSSKLEYLTRSGKSVKIRHNYMLNGKCKLLGVPTKSNIAKHEEDC
ncbi:hypothetical protein SUGI_0677370 [Cryptomeria japonica]|nr:hypothetical protein SUGI_0677370 [Cryptomeria japonica]